MNTIQKMARRWARKLACAQWRFRETARLALLDPRQLADIGLARYQIEDFRAGRGTPCCI